MKSVILHPSAKSELKDSAIWYNDQDAGLGDELLEEVSIAFSGLDVFPEMWPVVYDDIRRCPIRRFPYSILYQLYSDKIYVYAIMHHSRKPGYWLGRLIK